MKLKPNYLINYLQERCFLCFFVFMEIKQLKLKENPSSKFILIIKKNVKVKLI